MTSSAQLEGSIWKLSKNMTSKWHKSKEPFNRNNLTFVAPWREKPTNSAFLLVNPTQISTLSKKNKPKILSFLKFKTSLTKKPSVSMKALYSKENSIIFNSQKNLPKKLFPMPRNGMINLSIIKSFPNRNKSPF